MSRWGSVALVLLAAGAAALSTDELSLLTAWMADPGPYRIEAHLADWHDASRERTLPVKVLFPSRADKPFGAVVFSTGLGATRDGYDYLARHWAGHGYLVVIVQHPGTDNAIFADGLDPAEAMRRVGERPDLLLERPLDMRFVLDVLEQANNAGPLRGRLNLDRLAVAGHSFGGYAAMSAAGMTVVTPTDELRLGDPRVRAAVILSPPVPEGPVEPERQFGSITVPALYLTCTGDVSPLGETTPARRRVPFESGSGDRRLITFRGGDHFIFAGWRGGFGDGSRDERFHDLIEMASVAFLDATLRGDASAREWLDDGGFTLAMRGDGRLERRPAR